MMNGDHDDDIGKHFCSDCNKEFARKENLKYHIEKEVCKKEEIDKGYKCKYCQNQFTTKNSMYRHMKHSCEARKIELERKEIYDRLVQLELENKNLKNNNKRKVRQTAQTVNNANNGTNNGTINANMINNGTINNINNVKYTTNIVLVGFGKEDYTKIAKKDLLKSFKSGFNSAVELLEIVHFNPKYPEFHNVYIPNMKNKYAMCYDGSLWELAMKKNVVEQIYDDNKSYIDENKDEYGNLLSNPQKKSLQRWIDLDDTDGKHAKIKSIKENITLMLYNKKYIPIETKGIIDATI